MAAPAALAFAEDVKAKAHSMREWAVSCFSLRGWAVRLLAN